MQMKQIFLAAVLIIMPVAAFTGYNVVTAPATAATNGLGDLSSFKTIIADVQAKAGSGDLKAAAARITDWESAWDQGETAIRPLNPVYWGNVDAASDAALAALRAKQPSADAVKKTLASLMAVLNDPSQPAP
jgi:hypothetical protein